jgi:glutamate-1-semialdehyde 2,1-aminomutase
MSFISPEGDVYQAGTLSGNPVAMSAGIAQLTECLKPNFYLDLETKTKYLVDGINKINSFNLFKIFSLGSIFWIAFTKHETVKAAEEIDAKSMSYFKILYHALLESGVYLGPSGYEVGFISAAHKPEDLNYAVRAFCDSLDCVFAN